MVMSALTEIQSQMAVLSDELDYDDMLRLHVLCGWLHAINARIEELGGKIEG